MEKRIYNFSAGPAVLPEEVLLEAQKELFALPGVGMSVMEISHRSKTFDAIINEAKENLHKFDIPLTLTYEMGHGNAKYFGRIGAKGKGRINSDLTLCHCQHKDARNNQ